MESILATRTDYVLDMLSYSGFLGDYQRAFTELNQST
jgi:hypothetical protein